jgi:transketolase
MSLPDVAFFRSFCHVNSYNDEPAVRYFFPSDAVSCYRITELMANLVGCCYLRTLRADTPVLYKLEEPFEVGGYKVLREGKDIVFVSAGYMVHECLKAADALARDGMNATVIDAYSMPLQCEAILKIAQRNGGSIVTVEDNYTGGLDAELATANSRRGAGIQIRSVVVDRIPKSGRQPDDLLNYCHVGQRAILNAATAS